MKPSWNDAPEWANYLAMDEDGLWCWHEEKPDKKKDCFWESGGKMELVREKIYWGDSLEERPNKQRARLSCI
jgi:hypothetical protein